MLYSWLHLLALALYLGSMTGLQFLLLPSLSALQSHQSRVEFLARGLRLFNPMQVGALGLVVLSGAIQLTDLKAAYRELFVRELGMRLGLKLALSFFLILLSVYQSMGVAHRFVRRLDGGDAVAPDELRSLVRRLRTLTLSNFCLAAATLWLGARMRG